MTKQKFGLTGTALKTIALVLMVMDHIHYFFEFTPSNCVSTPPIILGMPRVPITTIFIKYLFLF